RRYLRYNMSSVAFVISWTILVRCLHAGDGVYDGSHSVRCYTAFSNGNLMQQARNRWRDCYPGACGKQVYDNEGAMFAARRKMEYDPLKTTTPTISTLCTAATRPAATILLSLACAFSQRYNPSLRCPSLSYHVFSRF
ncbi:hypothetical protein AAVH_33140, partial [Aphelenchoides avenae]